MKEYKGKGAEKFKAVPGNKYILFPGILRAFPKTKKKLKILDIGCGNGEFYEHIKNLRYEYCGLDSSKDMVKIATQRYPNIDLRVATAFSFSDTYKNKFDVVMSSMVFPCFSSKEKMVKCLKESAKVLKKSGKIIIGTSHPNFDAYMRNYFGWMADRVETKFKGYFKSGQKFLTKHDFEGHTMIFEDYHWTFSDYLDVIIDAGLKLVKTDECPPEANPEKEDYVKEKSKFPTRLVLVATK